jgi:hypothetical protein
MPGGDRTGPRGQGPMRKGDLGWCRGAKAGGHTEGGSGPAGAQERGPGKGRRQRHGATDLLRGAGIGAGSPGNAIRSSWIPQEQLDYPKEYMQELEEAITAATARMDEIKKITQAE